jgi:hypothetical protein
MARETRLLIEVSGVTLFAIGTLLTFASLDAETPAQALLRGIAKIPAGCEAGFLNHGSYFCWFTVKDHPFVLVLSVATLVVGAVLMVWGYRRFSLRRSENGA